MEMFSEFSFEAAYLLAPALPDGHIRWRLHGYSFRVELHFAGIIAEREGWIVDFADIKAPFKPFLASSAAHRPSTYCRPRNAHVRLCR